MRLFSKKYSFVLAVGTVLAFAQSGAAGDKSMIITYTPPTATNHQMNYRLKGMARTEEQAETNAKDEGRRQMVKLQDECKALGGNPRVLKTIWGGWETYRENPDRPIVGYGYYVEEHMTCDPKTAIHVELNDKRLYVSGFNTASLGAAVRDIENESFKLLRTIDARCDAKGKVGQVQDPTVTGSSSKPGEHHYGLEWLYTCVDRMPAPAERDENGDGEEETGLTDSDRGPEEAYDYTAEGDTGGSEEAPVTEESPAVADLYQIPSPWDVEWASDDNNELERWDEDGNLLDTLNLGTTTDADGEILRSDPEPVMEGLSRDDGVIEDRMMRTTTTSEDGTVTTVGTMSDTTQEGVPGMINQ